MISHKHKCIFIHIPKCAGTSVKYFLFPDQEVHWFEPNYDVVHGFCPERKIFMQHATSKQLLETGLITKEQWDSYYKFTFVRNPWDRAVSDYFWLMNDQNIKDSFNNYLNKTGKFKHVLNYVGTKHYRGEHVIPQSDFFSEEGTYKMDFVGGFENFSADMNKVVKALGHTENFNTHINKAVKKKAHYSKIYSNSQRDMVDKLYKKDIEQFGYTFDDQRTPFNHFKHKFR